MILFLPWLAAHFHFSMSRDPKNLLLQTVSDTPQEAAQGFTNLLFANNISFISHFSPDYDAKSIIFRFPSIAEKEKALKIENLNEKLIALKFISIVNLPHNHREVFVYSLSPSHFQTSDNKNLNQTVKIFNDKFLEIAGANIIQKIHFLQDYINGVKQAPRSMIVTFKSLDDCNNFINSDTQLPSGTILSRHKKFNVNIKHMQCNICRKTNHRKGHSSCDLVPRCPRCWSSHHTNPQSCNPYCWSCGAGHVSNSNRCPLNRQYVKNVRDFHKNKEHISSQTASTPVNHRQLHADVISLGKTLANKSYSAVVRNINDNSNQNTENNPSINNIVYDMAYIAACKSEKVITGSFQRVMDDYFKINNIPLIKHPVPDLSVVQFYSSQTQTPNPVMQQDSASHSWTSSPDRSRASSPVSQSRTSSPDRSRASSPVQPPPEENPIQDLPPPISPLPLSPSQEAIPSPPASQPSSNSLPLLNFYKLKASIKQTEVFPIIILQPHEIEDDTETYIMKRKSTKNYPNHPENTLVIHHSDLSHLIKNSCYIIPNNDPRQKDPRFDLNALYSIDQFKNHEFKDPIFCLLRTN